MPFLPLDIDAKRKAAVIGNALTIGPAPVLWGLTELWEFAWRAKRDVLRELEVLGCIGPNRALLEALVEQEFLEVVAGGYRVRGAKRWLFGMEGRSRGGHAAKSNLIPGARQKKKAANAEKNAESDAEKPAESENGVSRLQPRGQPRASPDPLSAEDSALTPRIPEAQNPLLFAGEEKPPPANRQNQVKAKPAVDQRLTPLQRELEAIFEELRHVPYRHEGAKDTEALKKLLRAGSDDEIRARWRAGLLASKWPACSNFAQLNMNWNALSASQGPPRPAQRRVELDPDCVPAGELLARLKAKSA